MMEFKTEILETFKLSEEMSKILFKTIEEESLTPGILQTWDKTVRSE